MKRCCICGERAHWYCPEKDCGDYYCDEHNGEHRLEEHHITITEK